MAYGIPAEETIPGIRVVDVVTAIRAALATVPDWAESAYALLEANAAPAGPTWQVLPATTEVITDRRQRVAVLPLQCRTTIQVTAVHPLPADAPVEGVATALERERILLAQMMIALAARRTAEPTPFHLVIERISRAYVPGEYGAAYLVSVVTVTTDHGIPLMQA